ncbi:MAG: chromate efflux transporter [Actinomycetota bacterium]|nr:chromate efflux transporter [Actinomycetota bacterium]
MQTRPSLIDIALQWGKIGIVGFGGPPAHIRLFRRLCVEEKKYVDDNFFEDAMATCNLLPGPASTQLAIFLAFKLRGYLGAIVGAVSFISPGLFLIILLAEIFLSKGAPNLVVVASEGAASSVGAIAISASKDLIPASWGRKNSRFRWITYVILGFLATLFFGQYLVFVLIGCGLFELLTSRPSISHKSLLIFAVAAPVAFKVNTFLAIIWIAIKVGALSYGGGFVIIPLMRADAVNTYHLMTNNQFLDAVVLGQITPGPVVQTVAVVGFSARGVLGALIAAIVAFSPSLLFVMVGGRYFERIRNNINAKNFLNGAGPAAIGAIAGASVPLALALNRPFEFALLGVSLVLLIILKRSVTITLIFSAVVAVILFGLGAIS